MGCGFAFFVAIKWGDIFSARWIWKKFSSFFLNGYKNAVLAGYHLRGENSLGWIKKWGGSKWPTPKSETKNEKNRRNFVSTFKKRRSRWLPLEEKNHSISSLKNQYEKKISEKVAVFAFLAGYHLRGKITFKTQKSGVGQNDPDQKTKRIVKNLWEFFVDGYKNAVFVAYHLRGKSPLLNW